MSVVIRPAQKSDMEGVLKLIQELADFEREPDAVEVDLKTLEVDGFGPDPKFHCFVAAREDQLLGMALCYPRYSTWKGPVIHLEDLIVTESARGIGLGGGLLTEVIRYAREQGARRVSWEVLDWNEPAIAFYKARGASILRDWDVVQLDANGIDNYLKEYAGI